MQYPSRVRLRLSDLDAGFQAADNEEVVRSDTFRIERHRRPEIDLEPWKFEVGGHHTDDLCRDVVQVQHSADDVCVAAKASLPEGMADHTDLILTFGVFALDKCASEQRVDT